MIRVFISYCSESDGERATSLYHYLDQEEKIEPILAPKDREIVIENAEKIANEIDICNFFITFYTTTGKENRWVNQELGYAFNHVRQNNFKIIPIFNDRIDFNGFLTSKSHNFYGGFKLNEEEPNKTFKEIKKYLINEYKHPIKLGFRIENSRLESSSLQITLKAIIWIYNQSSKKFQDATLDFILPITYLFRWDDIPGNDDEILKEFLNVRFRIDWAKNAKFEKIDEGKTIRLFYKNNSLSLILNYENTKVSLKINDIRTDEFNVQQENSKLNIYPINNSGHLSALTFDENFYSFIKTRYESKIVPQHHSNKFTFNRNIQRFNILLEDILGLNVYEIPVKIRIPLNLNKLSFGVYINIPLFGTTYYQTKMEIYRTDWILNDFHCLKDNIDEKIIIDYLDSD